MALASRWPLRQWLMFMLHDLLLTRGAPAINQGFLDALADADPARQSLPGFVLPTFTDANITRGERQAASGPVLSLKALGRQVTEDGAPTNTYRVFLYTRLIWRAPQIGLNAPEDIDLFDGVMEDTLSDLLVGTGVYALTPTDPDTQLPALPDGATFYGCSLTDVRHQPMPVREVNGTTYVHGGYADHRAEIWLAADRPDQIGAP
ncbi:MAG: hypothetical protein JO250_12425 [Armatimonadetes bacterium]|nr:hypothetical protein [Armatimonadota bacterium]